jgi:hypothetical protein
MNAQLDNRELATVLAALRRLQATEPAPAILDIATNGDEFVRLNDQEIDELCERLNTTN